MKRNILLLVGAVAGLTACDGIREAMTAHVDVAARAGSQELSVTRLADLLGDSRLPLNEDVAKTVTQMWVDYQLLALAAAENDSLSDPATVDSAMWAALGNLRAQKFMSQVSQSWLADSSAPTEADYAAGDLLGARHILIAFPRTGQGEPPSAAVRDSIRQRAEEIRAQVTPANFAQIANRVTDDPGSRGRGGDLGLFPRGFTVPEFERAVLALKPGEISPLVETQFGYHIIYRTPFAEIDSAQFRQAMRARRAQVAESTYFAELEESGKVEVRANAPRVVRAVAADLDAHRTDRTVIATSTAGDFTAARLARWIAVAPPQQQLRQNIASAPDSVLPNLVRRFVQYELLLKRADSAGVTADTAEIGEIRRAFSAAITSAWSGLGVNQRILADSAKTPAERRAFAASRVESYMDALVDQRAQFVQVPSAVEDALRQKYSYRVNEAGIDRSLELAARIRAQADSARAAQQPPTAVPMPGGQQPSAPADTGQRQPAPKGQ